jgi:RNA polymerase sigma factor (sigma-70 family)
MHWTTGGGRLGCPVLAGEPTEGAWLSAQGSVNTNQFRTTLWTTVLAAGNQSSPDSGAALARLCQVYWPPVYAFVRKRTPSPEQAQDLTQSFFARFLEKNYVARAERNRGRFRSFLMTAVENFLCDEHDRANSLKRGGGQAPLSLDLALAEEDILPGTGDSPALAFDKRWARSLLDEVTRRLAEEYETSGRLCLFEHLQSHLWGDADSIPYEDLSKRLQMSTVHLRVLAHRMRQRYRAILREEIAATVTNPEEIESEIRYLLQVVSS